MEKRAKAQGGVETETATGEVRMVAYFDGAGDVVVKTWAKPADITKKSGIALYASIAAMCAEAIAHEVGIGPVNVRTEESVVPMPVEHIDD